MVIASQRTIYNISLQLAMMLDRPYNILSNTTLNEKFSIESSTGLPEGRYPALKYISIGIGGKDIIDNTEGYKYAEHSPVQGALFDTIPHVLRKPNEDLTPGERTRYRFRKIVNINGDTYVAYYLRVIDELSFRDEIFGIKETPNGTSLYVFDTNTSDILNPNVHTRDIEYDADIEYITKIASVSVIFSLSDLEEIQNVLTILKRPDANLSEMALCTGLDITTDNGIEAIGVQSGFFVNLDLSTIDALGKGKPVTKAIELGGSEPLRV